MTDRSVPELSAGWGDHPSKGRPAAPVASPDADSQSAQGGAPALDQEDRLYRNAFDQALRLLGQREHTVRELTSKLTGKGVDAATAGLVVDDLRGRGLQSDARFAEAFVHSRLGRGQGPVRIRQELARRGIDGDQADEWLTQPATFWRGQAAQVRTRKFGDEPPADRTAWNRQARFLAQRGFPADIIYHVLGGAED